MVVTCAWCVEAKQGGRVEVVGLQVTYLQKARRREVMVSDGDFASDEDSRSEE